MDKNQRVCAVCGRDITGENLVMKKSQLPICKGDLSCSQILLTMAIDSAIAIRLKNPMDRKEFPLLLDQLKGRANNKFWCYASHNLSKKLQELRESNEKDDDWDFEEEDWDWEDFGEDEIDFEEYS